MKYNDLILEKTYDEMTLHELQLCVDEESIIISDAVDKLRLEGIGDVVIVAYIHDLYTNYLIADEEAIAEVCGISNNDWASGIRFYWSDDMTDENPLKEAIGCM